MLAAVRSLLPSIAAAAADVDRQGAVDPQVIASLHDAGYFAMLQPKPFGGLEAEPEDYLTATRKCRRRACPPAGWPDGSG